MQKFKLPLKPAFKEIAKSIPNFFSHKSGVVIKTFNTPTIEGYSIDIQSTAIKINYSSLSDLIRALSELMMLSKQDELDEKILRRTPPFSFRGIMIDVSRNGVLTVDYLKKTIIKLNRAQMDSI